MPALLSWKADFEKVGFLDEAKLTRDRLAQASRGGPIAQRTHLGVLDSGSHRADSGCEKVLEECSLGKHLGAEIQFCFVLFSSLNDSVMG